MTYQCFICGCNMDGNNYANNEIDSPRSRVQMSNIPNKEKVIERVTFAPHEFIIYASQSKKKIKSSPIGHFHRTLSVSLGQNRMTNIVKSFETERDYTGDQWHLVSINRKTQFWYRTLYFIHNVRCELKKKTFCNIYVHAHNRIYESPSFFILSRTQGVSTI